MTEPLIDVTGARRRRARAKLRRRMTVVGVVVAVLGLVGGAGWLVGWSSVFAIEEVTATGLVTLDEATVLQTAAIPLGEPLARLDAAGAAERIRELPAVAEVKVVPRFPHGVTVEVTERTPVLVVVAGRRYSWVDAAGVVFFEGSEPPAGVMTARGVLSDHELMSALGVVAGKIPAGLREQVLSISGRTLDSIELELTERRRVVWGSADESELKADVLTALLAVPAKVYDVSAPNHPTTR